METESVKSRRVCDTTARAASKEAYGSGGITAEIADNMLAATNRKMEG